jgi:signal transduction histidine kinase
MGKIFEPFYTAKPHGMGLGLANTQAIIKDNHGRIEVESEEGLGTSFIIQFGKNLGGGVKVRSKG